MAEEKNGLFTATEQQRLDDNYAFRKRMIDRAFAEGNVPDSAKDIEAINGVLNSMDKAIYDNANARLKQQENQNKEAILDLVAESIKVIHSQKSKHTTQEHETEIDNKFVPLDVVDGEQDLAPESITLDQIMREGD